MEIKNDSIYFRINKNKKVEISYVAELENRSLSNLLETLIDEKILEWKLKIGDEKFNDKIESVKIKENVVQETDGDRLRKMLRKKNITLTQFKKDMDLEEYEFKKIFYRKGKVEKELANKIKSLYGKSFTINN